MPIINVIDEAVWLTDENLQIIAQNPAAETLMGQKLVTIEGEFVQNFLTPVLGAENNSFDKIFNLTSGDTFELKATLSTDGHQNIFVLCKAVPIIFGKQFAGTILVLKDLSREAEKNLQHQFVNMASHLLRTPLSLMQASIEVLLKAEPISQNQMKILNQLRAHTSRLSITTRELLNIFQHENDDIYIQVAPTEIIPILERTLEYCYIQYPNYKFNFNKSEEQQNIVLAADPAKLEIILLGLINYFTQNRTNNGTITVTLEKTPAEAKISIICNGNDVTPEEQQKAFWRFYPIDGGPNRMPTNYKLGLYYVKRLIELHNGRIWAETSSSYPLRVTFSIPVWGK